MTRSFAMTWGLTEVHGWGLLGVHTALYMMEQGLMPLLLEKPLMSTLRPANRQRLEPLLQGYERVAAIMAANPGKSFALSDFDVMHALSNGFQTGPVSERVRGAHNIGVVAYEDTLFDEVVLKRATSYDAMVVHSTYNRTLLEERGVPNVRMALQGIDPSEMHPGPRSGRFDGRFVIFSGGKLEFRKGQDIVLTAFRHFHQRHPDALLVTAWHNPWPELSLSIAESRHTPVRPAIVNGRVAITQWAAENGVTDGFLDLGFLGRDKVAQVLWDSDLAVFPNRCEGATNLVAMEAMACGVPCVLSDNTGHRDILSDSHSYRLTHQTPVPDPQGRRIGWGESSVEELVELLERAYTDRADAKAKADRALAFVQGERTWRRFAEAFVEACRV